MCFRTIVIRAAVTAAQDNNDAVILGADNAPREQRVRAARHNHWTQRTTQFLNDRRKAATRLVLIQRFR
jgi:hypothetical protein